MKLGIFILHYNTTELTQRLGNSIPEAIIIDNGSDTPFSSRAHQVLRLDKNYGFTKGWNKCIEHYYEQFDAFWLMNSDIIISRESIDRIKLLLLDQQAAILTPSFNCWMEHVNNYNTEGVRDVKVIEFTAPVVRKCVFDSIGKFDERFSRGWGVEFDFCYRAKQSGYLTYVDDGSNFYHIGQQTIHISEGSTDYNKQAHTEWMKGMTGLYGKDWQKNLFGDINYIDKIKV